ncbi:TPR-like protein [Dacryopinax primogenitus]|uniref:TPR-like protein n=1 Tax=Dacryopinax primogenitus (strain DJM 731) TaxID=1858805 RepID=M5FWU9_DACPD|nr:TPR-like protein [Dacryopinax primogenitus]EJU00889.1 TPR-like protein [Dacryopinax primogenitus]
MALPQPPSAADVQRALSAFDKMPLFMKSLPSEQNDSVSDEPNVALEALQSLVYEGTPDEIAQNFKDQGNEYFRGRRWREAASFYSQGVDAKPEDAKLRESLLLNRAACNLELQNYQKVLADTSAVLSLNTRAGKAFFRAGVALTKLSRYDESIDALERCAALQPDDAGVKKARAEARRGKETEERKAREKREKEALRQAVESALQARAIVPVTTQSPPPQEAYPSFDPSSLSSPSSSSESFTPPLATTSLLIPVLLLYPLQAQTDFLTGFPESATFAEQITPVLEPTPPWDTQGEYTPGSVSLYVVTMRGRVLKLGLGRRLVDVWPAAAGSAKGAKAGEAQAEGGDGILLRDGWVEVYVLPRGEQERKWVEDTKAKQKEGKA